MIKHSTRSHYTPMNAHIHNLLRENRRAVSNITNCNYPYEDCDVDYQLGGLKEQIQLEIAALQAQIDEIDQRLA